MDLAGTVEKIEENWARELEAETEKIQRSGRGNPTNQKLHAREPG